MISLIDVQPINLLYGDLEKTLCGVSILLKLFNISEVKIILDQDINHTEQKITNTSRY